MKIFPNLVFESGTFDTLYFYNTGVSGYSQEFYLDLLEKTFFGASPIVVNELVGDERYDDILFANEHHPNITKTYKSFDEFKFWMVNTKMHHTPCCAVRNKLNSIQIFSDPHDWNVCIIGCKTRDNQLIKEWLLESGNYERRMKSIDEFSAIWYEVAIPKMFDYAILNLKGKYLPFID
jgi:hypothetical protein